MEKVGLTGKRIALFLSGANLMIIQFMMIRNFSSILFGTEIIILMVTLSYFVGFSLGYYWSESISIKALEVFSAVIMLVHFTFPFSVRYFSGFLMAREFDLLAFSILLFFSSFLLSSFYSLLLPRFISEEGNLSTAQLYRWELFGGLAGLFLLFVSSQFSFGTILVMTTYLIALAAIFHILWKSKIILATTCLLIVSYSFLYAKMEQWSVSYFYQKSKGMDAAKYVFSADTVYQRVEIIENEFGVRNLYLDGIRHFGDDSLSDFNYYIAGLPASLIFQPSVLIVGSGSLGSLYQVLPVAKDVDTVEIDKVVVESGRKYFGSERSPQMDVLMKEKWSLHIDDAKHFLKNSKKKYDLVAMDIAGPLQMQVALLYTEEFYRIVSEKLKENGVIAVSLNGQIMEGSVSPCRIVKTLSGVFKEVYVIAPNDDSNFAFAGNSLPFKKKDLMEQLQNKKLFRTKVYENKEIGEVIARHPNYETISQKKMDIVLKRGWKRLLYRYFDVED